MKYLVNVNNRYLVSVDVDGSALAAEHQCLDLDGVATATAYDLEGMKTETFRADCMTLETIAWWDLQDKSRTYASRWKSVGEAKEAATDARHTVADLKRQLNEAEQALVEAERLVESAWDYARAGNVMMGLPKIND